MQHWGWRSILQRGLPPKIPSTRFRCNSSHVTTPTLKSPPPLKNPVVRFERRPGVLVDVPLKLNPQKVSTFQDLKVPAQYVEKLHDLGIESPNSLQKKILALLASGVSLSVLAPKGSGTSTTIALYMTQTSTLKGPAVTDKSITNLILVPSAQLANQYCKTIRTLAGSKSVASTLFRADAASNEAQEEELKQNVPHTLIATPTRLLDFLSIPEKRKLAPLQELRCVAIDEADWLFKDEKDKQKLALSMQNPEKKVKKRKNQEAPIDLLLDHVVTWRNAYLRHNVKRSTFSPLRLIVSSSGHQFNSALKTKSWLLANKRPLISVGSALKNLVPDTAVKVITQNDGAQWVNRLASEIKSRGNGLVIIPDGAPLTAMAEQLSQLGIHTITANQSSTGYSEEIDFTTAFTNSNNPLVVLAKPLNIQGINFPHLKNLYIVTWKVLQEDPSLVNLLSLSAPQKSTLCVVDENESIPTSLNHIQWHLH